MQYSNPSSATELSTESTSAATMAAFAHVDQVIKQALSRSTFGTGSSKPLIAITRWTTDDVIAFGTMIIFFLIAYLVLLALKILLGIVVLTIARSRYQNMKQGENETFSTGGKKIGGWGLVDVSEEKRKWIYADDPDGIQALREREAKGKEKDSRGVPSLDGVARFSMVSKRIW